MGGKNVFWGVGIFACNTEFDHYKNWKDVLNDIAASKSLIYNMKLHS